MTQEQRREHIVAAAVIAFGGAGYAGTTTDQIARQAGVSQAYVIRVMGTKQELFLAALRCATARIEKVLRAAAGTSVAGGNAVWSGLLDEREPMALLVHGFAAAQHPAIGEQVRRSFGTLCTTIHDLTGADVGRTRSLLGDVMLTACVSVFYPPGLSKLLADLAAPCGT